jgi:hypothetical protein
MKVKPLLHCHLLTTGVFAEMADAAPCLPGLEALLAFSRKREVAEGGAEPWLCQAFGVKRQNDWPAAPFAVLGEGMAPGSEYWLRADPVHFLLLLDSLALADCMPFDLTLQQAQSLVEALNRHFAADGLQFFAPDANRWYLRLAAPPALTTRSLAEVIGQNVHHHLPQGADAMKWRGWLNEVQMLLHGHPVNLEREQHGKLPVNSVWPWGGGVLPKPVPLPFTEVWAQDVLVRGLVQANGGQTKVLPVSAGEWLEQVPADGAHLIVAEALQTAQLGDNAANRGEALIRLERQWFAPLFENLRRGLVASIHLHLAGPRQVSSFTVGRGDLWRFWRRPKPLRNYLHG